MEVKTMLPVLEGIGIFLSVVFVLTQMIGPALTGGEYFWFFRKSQKKVVSKEKELSALKTQEQIVDLDDAIVKKKISLNDRMVKRGEQESEAASKDKPRQ